MLPCFDPWWATRVTADVVAASYASSDALAARRTERLARLLASAARAQPAYRKLLAGRDPSKVPLGELPVTHRTTLMARFDRWVADPEIRLDALRTFMADPDRIGEPFLGRYMVWESSGSSGEPAVFVQDAAAMAVYDALEAIRRPAPRTLQALVDPLGLGERNVFVGAIEGHFASVVSIARLRRLNPLLSERLRTVSFLQPLHKLIQDLETERPTVMATYPSAAMLLADERLAGRLAIAPREIWTGGETLSPAMRRYIERAFHCAVVNSYGASEFLTLACECDEHSLHLNSDWAILESVDANGVAVPDGATGAATLLTNLANHVQPLIRYELGDRVTVRAGACRCGSSLPVIDVLGRCDDTLQFTIPDRPVVQVLPLALCTVLEDEGELFDFQLVQTGPAELLLQSAERGDAAIGTLRRASSCLAAFLAAQGAGGVRIHGRTGQRLARGRSGKLKRVIGLPG